MNKATLDPSLYLVVGSHDVDSRGIDKIVRSAVDGGVSLVQLREKRISTRQFIAHACSLRDALAGTDVPVLINDRVDVALAAEVDGVHVGQDDMHASHARRLLGVQAIVGLTVHNKQEIQSAPHDDLDYLSIGGVFVTASKDNTGKPVGLDGLAQLVTIARNCCNLPLTAIAGIANDNAASVLQAGVDGIAVISAIAAQTHPDQAAAALNSTVQTNLNNRT